MKSLTNYINEKLIVNKNYKPYTYAPKSFDELRKIIEDRYDKLGPGREQNPIDFNDIDVSNIDSFYNTNAGEFGRGIFQKTKFDTLIYRIGMFQILSQCETCFICVKN